MKVLRRLLIPLLSLLAAAAFAAPTAVKLKLTTTISGIPTETSVTASFAADNGKVLTADSTATSGVSWKALSTLNAGTATALAANGGNCSAGQYPLGVDASGAVESCTAASPSSVDYLVGTADGTLSGEIAVGTSPGGELGGTWASPTLDDSVTVNNWVLGTSTATSINKVAFTAPATGSTLTIADGKTLTVSNDATVSGTNTGDQTTVSGNAGTVTFADAASDTTTFVALGTAATGSLAPATDSGLAYNASTDQLTAKGVWTCSTPITSDQTLIGTSFADITGLSFAIAASTNYRFIFYIWADSDATTTGIDVAVNGPASPTAVSYEQFEWAAVAQAGGAHATTYDSNSAVGSSNGATQRQFNVNGYVQNGVNAGTLAARIKRENVGSGPNVRAGSYGCIMPM